ncbi:hypothetical protein [Aeromicrobium sp. IC_218]|uniref:hypothetical protein n=1 Tax=Aeromicrobium sp. IC_218 TaxID=2545468 RepID=UPI00103C163F|nr:hypothetical protein [Aeromicrobium sp. IC_218]TCI98906.1 hypothetical protein E0W78_09150 [Aeromicrobium sp. IC_218]
MLRMTIRALCWGAALGGAGGLLLGGLILAGGGISGSPLERLGAVAWIGVVGAVAGIVVSAPTGLVLGLWMHAARGGHSVVGTAIGTASVTLAATVLLWLLGFGPFGIPYAGLAALVALVPIALTVRAEKRRATVSP